MGWLGGPDGMEATGSDGRRGRRGSLGLPAAALAPVIDNVAISDLTVAVGQTVSAVITYTEGTPPFTETYQWSLGGSPISGATSSTYTATTAGALTVAVESTNDEGSDTATSGAAQVYVVPAMTSVTIDDTAVSTGDTLTASWTTSGTAPITVALQWVRAGVDISGATGTTYVTQPADGGQVIQVRATPSNPGATGAAVLSPPTTVYDPPVVVSVALSSYAALLGATLTATATVTGTFPITTTWRWLRDGVAISGATTSTYTLVEADVDTLISAEATAAGVVATSAPTVSPTATVTSGFTRNAVVRSTGADVLRTAANYALPSASWSIVGVMDLSATDAGSAPHDILNWGYTTTTGGGLLFAVNTGTTPDRIRCSHTRAPSTAVPGEVVMSAGTPDITAVGRCKFLITYDGSALRTYYAQGSTALAPNFTSSGAIVLGGGAPITELSEWVGKLSWAMGDVIVTEADFLAASEASWDMPHTLIAASAGTVIAGRRFNAATIGTTANVQHTGTYLIGDAGALNTGSARLTSEA